MEKQQEAAQDSISTMGKPEYPSSEVYVPEPPPAYRRERGTAVQIARIAALTVVAVSLIISFSMLASAYITATLSCSSHYDNVPQDHPQAQPLQQQQNEQDDQPSYQHLVDPLQSDESMDSKHETMLPPPPPPSTQDTPSVMQIKLPLTLDFDDIAGSLMEKNQRSRMNCVVEKRRAEEVMNHQPKTVRLPFGVNLTTDPRYEHISGERMAIFCESGHDQRHVPMESAGTPIVVPVPVHQGIPMNYPQMPMHHGPMHQHQNEHPMQQNMPMMSHHGPIPIMATHQQMQQSQHSSQPQAISLNQIPIPVLTRIAQESLGETSNEPVHIIAREENVIPMEGRAMHQHPAVPSDMVRPPPLPTFQRLPVHVMQQQVPNVPPHPISMAAAAAAAASEETEQPRPHLDIDLDDDFFTKMITDFFGSQVKPAIYEEDFYMIDDNGEGFTYSIGYHFNDNKPNDQNNKNALESDEYNTRYNKYIQKQ